MKFIYEFRIDYNVREAGSASHFLRLAMIGKFTAISLWSGIDGPYYVI